MDQKMERYLVESLAASGLCVLNSGIAARMRPDLWTNIQGCAGSFNGMPPLDRFADAPWHAEVHMVTFRGDRSAIPVVARSGDSLDRRLHWLTGREVVDLQPWEKPTQKQAEPIKVEDRDPIPNYPCEERTRRLAELGLPDDLARQTRFPRRRAGL